MIDSLLLLFSSRGRVCSLSFAKLGVMIERDWDVCGCVVEGGRRKEEGGRRSSFRERVRGGKNLYPG